MKLFEWLDAKGHPDSWLAEKLGISKPAVSAYKHGKTAPSLENAIKIHELTNGEVSYKEMLTGVSTTAVNQSKNELEDL